MNNVSDPVGNCMQFNAAAGSILEPTNGATVLALCVSAALTGSCTITGMTQASGAAQAWVNNAGTVGYVAPPGSGKGYGLTYVLSNVGADAGKCVLASSRARRWLPLKGPPHD